MGSAPTDLLFDTIVRLSFVAEFRDADTSHHLRRISLLGRCLGEAVGLASDEVELLALAAPMHDVGMVAIPDDILLKPARLTPDERIVMQDHTVIGARLLGPGGTELMNLAFVLAHGHHERWDGTGYPDGLVGEQTPLPARILGLCDVYDAVVTKRVYKPAGTHDEAARVVRDGAGTQFDPAIAAAFFRVEEQIRAICAQFNEDDDGQWLA